MHDDLQQLLDKQVELAQFLHSCGSLAPLAATMNAAGDIASETFIGATPGQTPTAEEAVQYFCEKFAREAAGHRASIVVFHADVSAGRDRLRVARSPNDAHALVAWLHHGAGDVAQVVIPYSVTVARRSGIAEVHYSDPQLSAIPRFPSANDA